MSDGKQAAGKQGNVLAGMVQQEQDVREVEHRWQVRGIVVAIILPDRPPGSERLVRQVRSMILASSASVVAA